MTTIGGTVSIGAGVVFRSHVAIQPGAQVVAAPHGNTSVPIPLAVPNTLSGHKEKMNDGIVFAKSANVSCAQAGVRNPVQLLEINDKISSMSVSKSGILVTSGKTMVLYTSMNEKMCELKDRDFSGACVAFEDNNTIVAVTNLFIGRLDLQLDIITKVRLRNAPGLSALTYPYALAIGSEGRLYTAGNKKCHIIDSTFSESKSFAEKSGQAFAIAVSKSGNVYIAIQSQNTVHVFSPDGSSLFIFGAGDREPIPHMSLHVPMSIALDSHDNVYVGIALQSITKFDGNGKFLEQFAASVNFKAIPKPMCMNSKLDFLYVAMEEDNGTKVFVYNTNSSA